MDETKKIFRQMLDRAAELVQSLYAEKAKQIEGDVPKDLLRHLDKLQENVDDYVRIHEEAIKKIGMTEGEIQAILAEKDPSIPPEDQRLISYAKQIADDAKRLQRGAATAVKKTKEGGIFREPSGSKKKGPSRKEGKKKEKNRKKKFKRLGGDDQWIPL